MFSVLFWVALLNPTANEPVTPPPYTGPCWFSSPELYSMEDIAHFLDTLDEYGAFGAKIATTYSHGVKWYVVYPKGVCLKRKGMKAP